MYVPEQQKAEGSDFLTMGGHSSGIEAGGARFLAAPARLWFCPRRPVRATLHAVRFSIVNRAALCYNIAKRKARRREIMKLGIVGLPNFSYPHIAQ